ncbi:hypothetical protein [Nonomuraea jabiensis]|uniref:hypothetical protein n=1 Tax=Nonomuraea jabiensis TaxID=882448 RepID=UPI003D70DB83
MAPLVEEVVVGDGDEQRDQDGLGDAGAGEPVLRVAQVEVVVLERPFNPSVIALAVEYVLRQEGLRQGKSGRNLSRWPSSIYILPGADD